MSNDPVSDGIRFSSYCLPPLAPGEYKLKVRQTVTELLTKDPFAPPAFEFAVAGPRFGLNPADIYSVYPPEGSAGPFASSLPHVVFTRRTIPWERQIASWPASRPWMALLLLSAEDFKDEDGKFPKIEPRTVKDLVASGKENVIGPDIPGLKPWEQDDPCNTIDLDAGLFARLAPGAADLECLAHVREVSTDQKETASFLTDGSFSVVIGNRFPQPAQTEPGDEKCVDLNSATLDQLRKVMTMAGVEEACAEKIKTARPYQSKSDFESKGIVSAEIFKKVSPFVTVRQAAENRAILVSLEGLQAFLPPVQQTQGAGKKLRLAVLASWAFHCEERRPDFVSSMLALAKEEPKPAGGTQRVLEPLRLQFETKPLASGETRPPEGAIQYVRAAFSRGYAALNHNTRLGEKTVSWYRGPLAPLEIRVRAGYEFKAVPDALVQYDHTKGLMDLTYAGAAQLGRLLGLQDRSFAQALCEWRTEVQGRINTRLQEEALRRTLRSGAAGPSSERPADTELLEQALLEAMGHNPSALDQAGGTFQEGVKGVKERLQVNELPATVREWLARRVLLYGVPFLYLVPDERMLPMPSMRFFRIDPLWIKRLLEGACSVGRNSTEAEAVDSILADEFFRIAVNGSTKVRRRPLPEEGAVANNAGGGKVKVSELPIPDTIFPFEGFLLRSPIVRGWQGLEMKAWYWNKAGEKKPAPPLRIDRLAPDIMLCIFNGPLAGIEIRQPPEGMHFGADDKKKTILRRLKADGEKGPGTQIDLLKDEYVEIPFRDEDPRVVNVPKLAELLREALTKKGGRMDDKPPLTSAEFGVQMTKSPGKVVIAAGDKS